MFIAKNVYHQEVMVQIYKVNILVFRSSALLILVCAAEQYRYSLKKI